jgi:Saxitoxin biosynthesis operon protein SxtJ
MITPNWYPQHKQLRQFAVAGFVAFGILGLLSCRKHDWHVTNAAYTLWSIGTALLLFGMALPDVIRPVYALLMAVTLPIGWVVSAVLLRLIFYVFLTPIGLIFRMIGRDPLRLKRPAAGGSLWIDHPDRPGLESYFRQA